MLMATLLMDRRFLAVLLAATLAGCGTADPPSETPETLGNELARANVAGIGDPMVATALQAPLMTDPTLSQSANADTIRPPGRPDPDGVPVDDVVPPSSPSQNASPTPPPASPCPECAAAKAALTPATLAAVQRDPAITACAARLTYSAAWANHMPRGIALYPDARLAEAAGTDAAGCRLRVARFASAMPVDRLTAWYHASTTANGWTSTHRANGDIHALSGRQGIGSYTLYLTPRRDGGSDIAIVTNGG